MTHPLICIRYGELESSKSSAQAVRKLRLNLTQIQTTVKETVPPPAVRLLSEIETARSNLIELYNSIDLFLQYLILEKNKNWTKTSA